MRSAEYWAERFMQLEKAQHKTGQDCYQTIIDNYRRCERDLNNKLNVWYQRFAENNYISFADAKKLLTSKELDELKWDINDYIKYGRENAISGEWMTELENASAKFHISRLEALKLQLQQDIEALYGNNVDCLDNAMRQIYTDGYLHTAFEIQKGTGVGFNFSTLDKRKIDKVIRNPWATDRYNFSQRLWKNKDKLVDEMNKSITRNIALGEDPQKAINEISRNMNVSKSSAGRLVMTEEAYFSSISQHDAFKDLGVEQYEIVATLDNRTSKMCRELDGKHFDMGDYWVGVTAPPFHCYCRTIICPYFDDEFTKGEQRAARGENGKTYYVPSNIKYNDWARKYVPSLTTDHKNDIINSGAIAGALNPESEEAIQHAKRYYNLVRKMKNDCNSISKKTGYPLSFVNDVKNHLFLTKHDLGKGELEYFFEDYEIAQSWQRLMDAKMEIQPHDYILLEHEHAEYSYMKQGMTQQEAHNKANEKYNYAKALKEREEL